MSRCRIKLWPSSRLSMIRRRLSTHHQRTVSVNVGSGGPVTIDLHNIPVHSPTDALIVHLPPFPPGEDPLSRCIPRCLQEWPVASINYRWGSPAAADHRCMGENVVNRFRWPTPVHDTAVAFRWITKNLMPWSNGKGNILIYGSYLGASLATSLSLTASRPRHEYDFKGLAAFNGIYNWTMFLPDHKINLHRQAQSKSAEAAEAAAAGEAAASTSHAALLQSEQMDNLKLRIEDLFDTPSNLFDPFASPSLFFCSPGLLIPKLFHMTAKEAAMMHALTGYDKLVIKKIKPPAKSYLDFPPHDSSLRIPDTLILHGGAPLHKSQSTDDRGSLHDFRVQAEELVFLMKRSIFINPQADNLTAHEAQNMSSRVRIVDVGNGKGASLNRRGRSVLSRWVRHRMMNL